MQKETWSSEIIENLLNINRMFDSVFNYWISKLVYLHWRQFQKYMKIPMKEMMIAFGTFFIWLTTQLWEPVVICYFSVVNLYSDYFTLKCIQSYNTISAILLRSCPCNCGVADCCGCFASAMDGNFAPECWLAEDTGNSLLLWLFSQPQPLLGHPWAQPQSCLLNPSIQPLAWDFC